MNPLNWLSRLAIATMLATALGSSGAQEASVLARGKYLMEGVVGCGNCHMQRGEQGQPLLDKGLSGGMLFDEPQFKARAANITPDAKTGIGRWSDAQLALAIREGVRPDKTRIGAPMPIAFFRHLSDADLAAIVAYLRAQPAVENLVPKSTYRTPPTSHGPSVRNVVAPAASNQTQYGEYLANIGHCMECHTPVDEQGVIQRSRLGTGGRVFNGPWGASMSRNLTPHASGLKDWSNAEIGQAVRAGVGRDGRPLMPPMGFAYYRTINDADMDALIAYLRSLKPQPLGGS